MMELKQSWQHAYDLGRKLSDKYSTEDTALWSLDMDELEAVSGWATSAFFHAGFVGREPEWVEAIRYGEIPEAGRSINWADHSWEPGVSCVKIIRDGAKLDSLYDYTLGLYDGRERIKVAGWWLGQSGSDGEPCLIGCVKVEEA